ncbi:hypothetical protein RRF57_000673 [Xylaria bambusicola]|uniref:Uncharacterized protein n=1 Tax=Xylaria bambusicola TaxID=326684 RepID=A0AAN7UCM2_9PEZI
MQAIANDTALCDPNQLVPSVDVTIPLFERVYKSVFASFLKLNADIFLKDNDVAPIPISWTYQVLERRISMSPLAFYISAVILGINTVTVVLVYARAAAVYLLRRPTTIVSILAYVAASRVCSSDWDDSKYEEETGEKPTFSFGRYVGTDGRLHVGIELDSYVTQINKTLEGCG